MDGIAVMAWLLASCVVGAVRVVFVKYASEILSKTNARISKKEHTKQNGYNMQFQKTAPLTYDEQCVCNRTTGAPCRAQWHESIEEKPIKEMPRNRHERRIYLKKRMRESRAISAF